MHRDDRTEEQRTAASITKSWWFLPLTVLFDVLIAACTAGVIVFCEPYFRSAPACPVCPVCPTPPAPVHDAPAPLFTDDIESTGEDVAGTKVRGRLVVHGSGPMKPPTEATEKKEEPVALAPDVTADSSPLNMTLVLDLSALFDSHFWGPIAVTFCVLVVLGMMVCMTFVHYIAAKLEGLAKVVMHDGDVLVKWTLKKGLVISKVTDGVPSIQALTSASTTSTTATPTKAGK